MIVVGMNSGTSADAIDAVAVEFRGEPPHLEWRLLAHKAMSYPVKTRDEIFAAFRPETGTVDRLCRLNFELGEMFASAALAAIDAASLKPDDVTLIASHGQTLWHDPPAAGIPGATLQMGAGAVIAERTGITTISNMRARDVAAGGHGAPVTSFLDWLLFRDPTRTRAIQNIGGIGNVTYLPPLSSSQNPLAFDTGPGNMLIDYAAVRATGGDLAFDRDGAIAARGQASQVLLDELMSNQYFQLPPPKTTGRELFGVQMGEQLWKRGQALHLSNEDFIATLTAFTAESIASSYRTYLPSQVDQVYLAGGGALNPTLVDMIRTRVAPAEVHMHDELGLAPGAKEAVAFAVIGYETWHGRPGNLPTCTGARHPVIMGDITPGRNFAIKD